ncbi:MAG: MFS transporter [Sandarakinorhabdus sp.]|nr:MFS transporter [Sandarakinorhabdus sp.]
MASLVTRATALPSVSENSRLRLGLIFILYAAQGVPLGLFYIAIPAWMAANGASAAAVGTVLGFTSLPWTLKFFNGFIMERYPYLPMGRRRAWLIGAQAIMVSGMLAMALFDPAVTDVALLSGLSFFIMTATTFQDVAIDGMAVDLVPEAERPRANGLMFGGQALGMAGAGAAAGFGIGLIGLSGVSILAAMFVTLLIACMALCRERPGERLLPWSTGAASRESADAHLGAWWPVLRTTWSAMLGKNSLLAMAPMMLIGMHAGLVVGTMPLVAVAKGGWSQERIAATTSGGSLLAGALAVILFGAIVARLGARRMMILAYALIALSGLAMLLLRDEWAAGWPITAMILLSDPLNFCLAVCLGTIAMKLCTPAVAATQFTLYMAISNLGRTLGSGALGPVDRIGGLDAMIWAIVAVGVAGAALATRIRT